jgi:hypothetical protein
MARPVDYRKGRGSKGVHTADERVPIGKKDQARKSTAKDQLLEPKFKRSALKGLGKHPGGHLGQKPKARITGG